MPGRLRKLLGARQGHPKQPRIKSIPCPISIACDGANMAPDAGSCGKCKEALERRKRGPKPPKGLRASGEAKEGLNLLSGALFS